MKTLLAAAALLALAAPGNAQGYTKVGFELQLKTPAGELGDWHQIGLGAAATMEYELATNWRATGQFGITRFAGKSIRGIEGTAPELHVIGGSAGLQSYLGGTPVYFGGEFGYYVYSFRTAHFSNEGLNTDFGVLPTLGYRTGTFDVSAQYKVGGAGQWLQLRAALYFVSF